MIPWKDGKNGSRLKWSGNKTLHDVEVCFCLISFVLTPNQYIFYDPIFFKVRVKLLNTKRRYMIRLNKFRYGCHVRLLKVYVLCIDSWTEFRMKDPFFLLYARHYNPRFVYFLPTFRRPFLYFQGGCLGTFCPYVWLVLKSGF